MDAKTLILGYSRDAREIAEGLERTKWGTVVADVEMGRTTMPRIWAGGDVVTGAATVVSAMGAGKQAAADINRFLRGEINPW